MLSRKEDPEHFFLYTVAARTKDREGFVDVYDVPHAAIRLINRPYHSDMHETGVFRHYIEIPDDMFPQAWRNLRGS